MDDLRNLNRNIKDLVDNLRFQFEKLASNIAGHVSDAMTEEMTVVKDTILDGFETVKGAGMSVYKFFVGSFGFDKFMMKETKKQTKLMKETITTIEDSSDPMKQLAKQNEAMLSYAKKDEFRKRKMTRTGKKGMWDYLMDFLGIPFLLAGAAVGAIVGVILAPFRAMLAIFNKLKFFSILGGILKLIPGVEKLFGIFGKVFGGIMKAVRWFESIPILGKLVTGFTKGFQKLFWPIQIIMSIFDFVEGWQATEGTIWDKALAGIKNAFMKFIEMPVQLLENAFNWVAKELGFGGVEKGTWMKGIGNAFDWVAKEFIPQLWDWVKGIVAWLWSGVKNAFKFMSDKDFDFAKIGKDLIQMLWDAIYDVFPNRVKNMFKSEDTTKADEKMKSNVETGARKSHTAFKNLDAAYASLKERIAPYERERIEAIKDQNDRQKEMIKLLEKMNYNITNIPEAKALAIASGGNAGGGGGSTLPPVREPKVAGLNESMNWIGGR